MNSFGRIFRLSILGESHGRYVGVLIDGCPAGLGIDESDFAGDMERRMGGAVGTTARKEADVPLLCTGVFNGRTTGAPVLILIENNDARSESYDEIKNKPRPGHADLAAWMKYGGFNDYRGGGHFSGRLTAPLAAAGVIAKKLISPAKTAASVLDAGGSSDAEAAAVEASEENDTIGSIVECRVTELPAGIGEPFFDSVESLISHAAFSIPGIKAIEFGAGFRCASMRGSEFNDPILNIDGLTASNNSGGINGGISNGNEIVFRVAVRPAASHGIEQDTVDLETGENTRLRIKGRHDACIGLRVPVVLEAVTACVLADLMMMRGLVSPVLKEKENEK